VSIISSGLAPGATLGKVWSSGSATIFGEYGSNSGIWSRQRSYLRDTSFGFEIFPAMHHYNAALTFRQYLDPL